MAKDELTKLLPDFDFGILEKADRLIRDIPMLGTILDNPKRSLQLYQEALNGYEMMLSSYLKQYPQYSTRELKN